MSAETVRGGEPQRRHGWGVTGCLTSETPYMGVPGQPFGVSTQQPTCTVAGFGDVGLGSS